MSTKITKAPRYLVIVIDNKTGKRLTETFEREPKRTVADEHGHGHGRDYDASAQTMRSWVNAHANADVTIYVYEIANTVTRPDTPVWTTRTSNVKP